MQVCAHRVHRLAFLSPVLSLLASPPAVHATTWPQEAALRPPTGWISDFYGTAVDLAGDVAVVGAPRRDDTAFNAGAAYVHRCRGLTWIGEATLLAADGAAGDLFGTAVAVAGDVAVVGTPNDDDSGDDAGAAYVFRHAGGVWTEETKLFASTSAAGALFGSAVATSGELVVVGVARDGEAGTAAGAAYVFRYDAEHDLWIEEQKLTASDAEEHDAFGDAVAIAGETVVVGAAGAASNAGAVYVFDYDGDDLTWHETQKLTASDGAPLDEFGSAVSVDRATIVVGAPLDDDDGGFSGAAFVFEHASGVWMETRKLTAPDAAAGDLFGTSVDVDDERLVVGAPGTDGAGVAHLFGRRGRDWRPETTVTVSDAASGDRLGAAVTMSATGMLVGAPRHDGGGSDAGSAFVFRVGMVGAAPGDRLGWALAEAGDVDGDGVRDLLLGSPFNDDRGEDAGRVDVYSGRTLERLYTMRGQRAGDRFGWTVAGAGDVDRDGRADVIVGAPRFRDLTGRVYVYSGADGARLHRFTGEATGDQFGYAVAGGVDVDDDGRDDVIVGAPRNDETSGNAGKVYVFSGRRGDLLGAVTGAAKGDHFGWSVAALTRADGDEHGDFVVGAPKNDDRRKNAGRVDVYSGRTFRRLYTLTGRREQDRFGYAVASLGRADGDGRDDFAVGAPFFDAGDRANAGRLEAFSGRDGTRLFSRVGQNAGDRFGLSVQGAGDADGDGRGDVIVGAPRHDAAGANAGRVYVRSGLDGATVAFLDGAGPGDQLGFAAVGLGDGDGDGRSDLLVGAPYEDTGGPTAGRAYLRRSGHGPAVPVGGAIAFDDGHDHDEVAAGPPPTAPGDLDGDGAIDERDLVRLLVAWGSGGGSADLETDDRVDASDLRRFIDAW